ncbi:hypothetical protein [Paenibacillus apiarius]|uniref:hypothetical protein n=1 Tax=Paenibacillus apiarius TaxID=46240 RepID=UPI003B3AF1D2
MLLFIMGKNARQAEEFWYMNKHKLNIKRNKVRFIPNRFPERMLDGHKPEEMVILLVGQYWENEAYASYQYRLYGENGALIINMSD